MMDGKYTLDIVRLHMLLLVAEKAIYWRMWINHSLLVNTTAV